MPTALVTGASTGIGYELSKILAREGYDLVLVARSREGLEKVQAEIESAWKRRVQVIAKDLSEHGAAVEFADELQHAGTGIDVLVNNAGFGTLGLFDEMDADSQVRMLELNVVALTELTRLLLPGMLAKRRGMIMNVASTAAFQPGPLMAVYYASKAYVLSFSEAIANELANRGITVTCLCPGPTITEFQKRAGAERTRLFEKNAMSARDVAEIGYRGMMAGKRTVVAGRANAIGAFLTRFTPRGFAAGIARRLQETKR